MKSLSMSSAWLTRSAFNRPYPAGGYASVAPWSAARRSRGVPASGTLCEAIAAGRATSAYGSLRNRFATTTICCLARDHAQVRGRREDGGVDLAALEEAIERRFPALRRRSDDELDVDPLTLERAAALRHPERQVLEALLVGDDDLELLPRAGRPRRQRARRHEREARSARAVRNGATLTAYRNGRAITSRRGRPRAGQGFLQ